MYNTSEEVDRFVDVRNRIARGPRSSPGLAFPRGT